MEGFVELDELNRGRLRHVLAFRNMRTSAVLHTHYHRAALRVTDVLGEKLTPEGEESLVRLSELFADRGQVYLHLATADGAEAAFTLLINLIKAKLLPGR